MPTIREFLAAYPLIATAGGLLLVLVAAWIANRVTRRVLLTTLGRLVRETASQFDDLLLQLNVFGRLAHLAPALAIHYGIRLVPGVSPGVTAVVQQAAVATMVLVVVSVIGILLTAVGRVYARSELAQGRPIEAYVQIVKLAVYLVGAVLFIAALLDRSPVLLLSGIGAITAVLLLIFRDTILSFVASLQITSYDMVRVGDWIEIDGADGDVIELSLHTVKVRNWDKTITTLPTYKLIEQPFKNWRGMQESGGRRIKRAFYIDMSTIRFLEEDELNRLENFAVLRDYIREKRRELAEYNRAYAGDPGLVVNTRRLTNVGTLRAYVSRYLRNHPRIHNDMTFLVRQLAPTPHGLPIEIYVFTTTVKWGEYEDIQSDVFDHVLAIVHEFGLRVFQSPSGADFARLAP